MEERYKAMEVAVEDEKKRILAQPLSVALSNIWNRTGKFNHESVDKMEPQEYFYYLAINLTGTSLKETTTEVFSKSLIAKINKNKELATHYLIRVLKDTTSGLSIEVIDDIEKSEDRIHDAFNSSKVDIIIQWMSQMDDTFLRFIALNPNYDNNTRLIAIYLLKNVVQVKEIMGDINQRLQKIERPKNPNEWAGYEYQIRVQKQLLAMVQLRLKKQKTQVAISQ